MPTGQYQARQVAADTEGIEVGRRVEVPIPAGQCQARPAAAGTVGIGVGRRVVEVPILADPCQARLAAAVMEEAETAAACRQAADRAVATLVALLMADTITTK